MSKAEFYQNILDTIRENYRYPFWAVFELLDNTFNCRVDVDENENNQVTRLICTFLLIIQFYIVNLQKMSF